MITVDEIFEKAVNLFDDYIHFLLESTYTSGQEQAPYFPLIISSNFSRFVNGSKLDSDSVNQVYQNSKNVTGAGYSLEIENINTRSSGRRSIIKGVFFDSEEDYLCFIGKQQNVNHLRDILNLIEDNGLLDQKKILAWAQAHLPQLLQTDSPLSFWENITRIAKWIVDNPNSNIYLREIPVDIPDNFIEENKALIHSLTSGKPIRISFESDHGLKTKPVSIRFRLLSQNYPLALGNLHPQELGLPLDDFTNLHLSPFLAHIHNVLIIENEMVYLTFPHVEGTLCILGSPYTMNLLKLCEWIGHFNIIYFGSIDEHSYDTLSRFRSFYHKTKSLCMDIHTLVTFKKRCVKTNGLKNWEVPQNLNGEEMAVFKKLRVNSETVFKLPQESISLDYMQQAFLNLTQGGVDA